MSVEVIFEDERWGDLDLQDWAKRAHAAALGHLGLDPQMHEVAVLACDDARIAVLNADFRGKPQATNVLSWPSEDLTPPDRPTDPEIGDIAIARETCLSEATAQGKSIADHVTHLLVHATLHLLGYDHIEDGDAALMEALETEILASLGIADPY